MGLKSARRCGIRKKKTIMLLLSLFFFDHLSVGIFLGSCKRSDLLGGQGGEGKPERDATAAKSSGSNREIQLKFPLC